MADEPPPPPPPENDNWPATVGQEILLDAGHPMQVAVDEMQEVLTPDGVFTYRTPAEYTVAVNTFKTPDEKVKTEEDKKADEKNVNSAAEAVLKATAKKKAATPKLTLEDLKKFDTGEFGFTVEIDKSRRENIEHIGATGKRGRLPRYDRSTELNSSVSPLAIQFEKQPTEPGGLLIAGVEMSTVPMLAMAYNKQALGKMLTANQPEKFKGKTPKDVFDWLEVFADKIAKSLSEWLVLDYLACLMEVKQGTILGEILRKNGCESLAQINAAMALLRQRVVSGDAELGAGLALNEVACYRDRWENNLVIKLSPFITPIIAVGTPDEINDCIGGEIRVFSSSWEGVGEPYSIETHMILGRNESYERALCDTARPNPFMTTETSDYDITCLDEAMWPVYANQPIVKAHNHPSTLR